MRPCRALVLVAAVFFAARQIISRMLSRSDRTATTVAYTALAGSLVLTLPLPFVWRWPAGTLDVVLLVGMSALAALAEVLVIRALEVAQAAVVARVGFEARIDLAGLEPGAHWLHVISIGADGYRREHRPQRFFVSRD